MDDKGSHGKVWPTELRVAPDRRSLSVSFDDGRSFRLSAEYLRVKSPSAEVQGHSPAERRLIAGKRAVEIVGVAPVGNYAVRITFDDMHSSGIYGWDYLAELGAREDEIFGAYLAELEEKGLRRDPPPRR